MSSRIERNKQFLTALFSGREHPGHGIQVSSEGVPYPFLGDFIHSDRPLDDWVGWALSDYEARLKTLEEFDDDTVPYVLTTTGVEIFPAAFGCQAHVYPDRGQLPMAIPLVATAEEAERLPEPSLEAPVIQQIFAYVERVRERAGPEVMVNVPDMQSPIDIAAMIWEKKSFLIALHDHPQAAKRLVDKCHRLLKSFLLEFKRRFPNSTLVNCPYLGAPAELGCEYAEDECGNMSPAAFEEFCLPFSVDMSSAFGGLFIHCCANAAHQYENFLKIPNLRCFEHELPISEIPRFSGNTVMVRGTNLETANAMLDAATPESRFLFIMAASPTNDAKRAHEQLRERCPRRQLS